MVYDSQSDRIILFGGLNDQASYDDDTWAYDFNRNTWTNMDPGLRPLSRQLPPMAYDSESDRVILFGGQGWTCDNGTWAYDFNTNTWTNMNPAVKPPWDCSGGAMAYDSESDRVIFFRGTPNADFLNDTWAYDFNTNTWANMDPISKPPAQGGQAIAYDSVADRVILFGGQDVNGTLNETWAYDFNTNTWAKLDPVARPPPRFHSAMAYDSQSDRMILIGYTASGSSDDTTWAYDFNANNWTNMDPPAKPRSRYDSTMAYDSESDRAILFGGRDTPSSAFLNDTWGYDFNSNSWTYLDTKPPSRSYFAMAYDSESARSVLFGGVSGGGLTLNDTWAYDSAANGWTYMGAKPPARSYFAMAYDSESDRVILFGGLGASSGYFNDTWAYDFNTNTWTKMDPVAEPPARGSHAMTYETRSDRVILFGGNSNAGLLNDTWATTSTRIVGRTEPRAWDRQHRTRSGWRTTLSPTS